MSISILTAQFDVEPNRVLELEDDTTAAGTPDDPHGCFLKIHGGTDWFTLFLPDETIERLAVLLAEQAPRLPTHRVLNALSRRERHNGRTQRERLDPGPSPEV